MAQRVSLRGGCETAKRGSGGGGVITDDDDDDNDEGDDEGGRQLKQRQNGTRGKKVKIGLWLPPCFPLALPSASVKVTSIIPPFTLSFAPFQLVTSPFLACRSAVICIRCHTHCLEYFIISQHLTQDGARNMTCEHIFGFLPILPFRQFYFTTYHAITIYV